MSEPYHEALQFINNNNRALAEFSTIRSSRLGFGGYSVQYSGPSGVAHFKILISGEKSDGVVYLDMVKLTGIWKVKGANLILNSNEAVSLVD